MRLMPARFLIGLQIRYGIRYFLRDFLVNGNARLNPEGTLDWDSSSTPKSDDFFGGDLQGLLTIWIIW